MEDLTGMERAAYLIAQAAALHAEIAGMQAANAGRAWRGQAPAYSQSDFTEAIDASACHHNAAMGVLRP